MIRHIVMWKHQDQFTQEEKEEHAKIIKERLEALKEKIPGVISVRVITDLLPSSSGHADLILDSTFESVEALNNYQVHPEHVKVSAYIGSVVMNRICIDYQD